jgi:UDP-N-acetylmuramoyl-tripeptide--D-alanyl-D-alanine ligase
MNKLLLSEIAKAVSGKAFGECEIKDISIDSRQINKDTLYVAIIGERFDGHTFCKSAQDNGAVAFMVSKEPTDCNLPYVLVDNTEDAFLELSKYYLSKLNIKRVAVTGSVGKTTTKEMVYSVLSQKYKTLKTQGNLNNQIGLPRTIFSLDDTYEAGVFELGMSDFGEISKLSKAVRPEMAIITKIGVSHMETLGSREGIMKAKLEVLDGMQNGAPLFVSADDDYLGNYTSSTHRVVKFAIKNKKADYIAEDIKENGYETEFTVLFNGNSQKVTIPTIGQHNVYDALSAFAVGMECGVSPKDIAEGLKNYKPSGMRQNVVNHNDITVIEDCYNASPDSMKASISTLDGMKCNGKKIAVLADMLELGHISKDAHYDVGKWVAESNIDVLLCYGDESKNMEKGAKDFNQKSVIHFDSKDDLNKELVKTVNKGDIVLFKGSRGMALEESIKFLYNHTDK